MFCPKCGFKNPDEAAFCGACGNAMHRAQAAAQRQASAPCQQSLVASKATPQDIRPAQGTIGNPTFASKKKPIVKIAVAAAAVLVVAIIVGVVVTNSFGQSDPYVKTHVEYAGSGETTIDYEYDKQGRLVKEVEKSVSHNNGGNIPLTEIKEYSYNDDDNVVEIFTTHKIGQNVDEQYYEVFTYDSKGKLEQSVIEYDEYYKEVIKYKCDADGRKIEAVHTIYLDGKADELNSYKEEFEYDERGRVIICTTRDSNDGFRWEYAYDNRGNVQDAYFYKTADGTTVANHYYSDNHYDGHANLTQGSDIGYDCEYCGAQFTATYEPLSKHLENKH